MKIPEPRRGEHEIVDKYIVASVAQDLLTELSKNGWNVGEVELLASHIQRKVELNNERVVKKQPFVI